MTRPNCGNPSCSVSRGSRQTKVDGVWVSNSPATDARYPEGSWIESRGTQEVHTTAIYDPHTHEVIGRKNKGGSWWSNLFNRQNK